MQNNIPISPYKTLENTDHNGDPHMKLYHCWWLYDIGDADHSSTDFQSCPLIISYCVILQLQLQKGKHSKNMLTLYCSHVSSRWLIKISLLNCNTPYIFWHHTLNHKVWWKELLDMELSPARPCLLVLSWQTLTVHTKHHFNGLCIQFSTLTFRNIYLYYKQKLECTSYMYL